MPETITVLEMQRTSLQKEYDKKKSVIGIYKLLVKIGIFLSVWFTAGGLWLFISTSNSIIALTDKEISYNYLVAGALLMIFPFVGIFLFRTNKKLVIRSETAKKEFDNKMNQINQDVLRQLEITNIVKDEKDDYKKYMPTEIKTPDTDSDKICPMCAEKVKAAAKICRFCRYEFDTSKAD